MSFLLYFNPFFLSLWILVMSFSFYFFNLLFSFHFMHSIISIFSSFLFSYFFQFYFLVDVLDFSCLPALYLLLFPSSPSLFARFSPTAFLFQAHPTSLVSGAANSNKTQPPLTWCPRISQFLSSLEKMFSYTLVISLP